MIWKLNSNLINKQRNIFLLEKFFQRHKGYSSSAFPYANYNEMPTIAVRREDASVWERRSPLAPYHVRRLTKKGVRVIVQPSNRRAYPLQAYVNAGAIIQEDISEAPVIIGVKQVPIDSLLPNKTYVFFSHTIKAQPDNMPLLDTILERNVRLIDYEKMVDANGRRIVAFGHYAGVAGMINILHGLGLRLLALGHHTPFMHIGPAHNYRNSGMARQAVRDCGYEIALGMMPRSIGPLTVVLTGTGNVSQGAQEILQELPYEYVDPKDLRQVSQMGSMTKVYATVVSRDDHCVRRDGGRFDMDEYEEHPERYYSNFATNIAPFASIIVNGIYWSHDSPRLLTIPDMKRLIQPQITPWLPSSVGSPSLPHRLLAICDISADPGGSIEFMTDCTTIDNPFCLYDANFNHHTESFSGPGVLVCSIDNMPTQIPLESTDAFGDLLFPYIYDIIKSDANKPFADENLSPVVKGAVIASNGKLTPNFQYIMDLRKQKVIKSSADKKHNVLVLGAGYVSAPLVDYLLRDKTINVTVASALQGQGEALAKNHSNVHSVVLDVLKNPDSLEDVLNETDLVISLLPYDLHPMIAKKCIQKKKNMVTTSYTSNEMRELHAAATDANISIVNEVGLDPGIDHLLAMECFDQVTSNGGKIISFSSYCGGLPTPENADNPLGYKFSWYPKGVLRVSTSSARFIQDKQIIDIPAGGQLMDSSVNIDFINGFNLEGYPNRDSIAYKDIYGISSAETVIRGTLRYKGFCNVMKGVISIGLIDDKPHPSLHPKGPETTWKQFLCTLLGHKEDILLTNLKNLILERCDGDLSRLQALETLGLLSEETIEKRETPLDTFSNYLSKRLAYNQGERDLIILRHEVGIEWPNGEREMRHIKLVVYGDPNGYSAMAKCVGIPAGITAHMLLNGEIQSKGIVLPITNEIYYPLLKRLHNEGISANEKITKL